MAARASRWESAAQVVKLSRVAGPACRKKMAAMRACRSTDSPGTFAPVKGFFTGSRQR